MRYFSPYEKGYGLRNYPFRVWDSVTKEMTYTTRNYFLYKTKPERYKVMECTKVRDANNILIYEYDYLHKIGLNIGGKPFIDMRGVAMKPKWSTAIQFVRADGFAYSLDDITYVTGNVHESEQVESWTGLLDTTDEGLETLSNDVYNPDSIFKWVVPVYVGD